ncbi:MAG: iron ABC transporter permease [Proteobacteria bacterium]|nr:iron ABC transporter permease [Pseudomonadota bacterium]
MHHAAAGTRRIPLAVAFAAGALATAIAVALGLLLGRGDLGDPALRETLLRLRLYRAAVAFGTGAALAVGGVLVQGLFRNPLASPSVLGATAGASLGGQLAMLLVATLGAGLGTAIAPEMFLPLGCMAGALLALVVLLTIVRGTRDLLVLLLCGFLLSSLCVSIGAFLTTVGQKSWELGRAMLAFTVGGVAGAGPRQVAVVWAIAGIGAVAAWAWARPLDVMLSGQEEAESLGVDTRVVRRWCVVWTALLSAGAVAVGGNIGFVGLVVPNAMRALVGVGHRALVPASALAGGVFLVLCDVAARMVPAHGELPLGVVTGLIGAPMFLIMLARSHLWGGGRA